MQKYIFRNKFTPLHRLAMAVPLAMLLFSVFLPYSKAAEIIPDYSNSLVAVADTVPPSDVENVKGAPGDGTITLTWNVATDNVGVKGYKLYYGPKSVKQDGNSYEKGPIDVGNKISYPLTSLMNGQKYYFALTAYDAAGNESENYSLEGSATPAHSAADSEAPKVAKAEAVNKTTVKVTFSESIKLPTNSAESAFTIKNDSSSALLEVKSAVIDPANNKSVLLTTAPQQAGASYILTAGIALKDMMGNPLISGTADTAAFTGTDIEPASTGTPTQQKSNGPELKSVTAMDSTHVDVVFSEAVVLKADARENFIITEEQNIENTLDIQKVDLSASKTRVTLTTAPQKAIKYNLIAIDVANESGAMISVEKNATTFTGMAAAPGESSQQTTQEVKSNDNVPASGDKTPPEDASDLVAAMIKDLIVTLSWKQSINTAGDLANYVLYTSTDGKTYGEGVVIDPANSNFDINNLLPQVKYFFKLVARDKTGNESKGVMVSFRLPGVGPELMLFAVGALGLGKMLKRHKKSKQK